MNQKTFEASKAIETILNQLDDENTRIGVFYLVGFSLGILRPRDIETGFKDISAPQEASIVPKRDHDERSLCDDFRSLAKLIQHAGANTGWEKALLAAFWVEICHSKEEGFTSNDVKGELKKVRHKPGNVSYDLSVLSKKGFIFPADTQSPDQKGLRLWQLDEKGIKHIKLMLDKSGQDPSP